MEVATMCIIAARSQSTRLERKMLRLIGGETLLERGHRLACEAFGKENVVIAMMHNDLTLFREAVRIGAQIFEYHGEERDVLGRFHAAAHRYRWHPQSVLHRWTCDDPFKSVEACRRVAAGERLPVELGGEAFTLAMLDDAHMIWNAPECREHITHALFPNSPPPPCPPGDWWTIDTPEQLAAARAKLAEMEG